MRPAQSKRHIEMDVCYYPERNAVVLHNFLTAHDCYFEPVAAPSILTVCVLQSLEKKLFKMAENIWLLRNISIGKRICWKGTIV